MYKNLPKTYRLGAHKAHIRIVDGLSRRDKDPCFGLCDLNTYDIYLASEHNAPHLAANTILHELFHSILAVSNVELKDKLEERIVDALATWTLGLIKDNPQLIKWLINAAK